MDPISVVSNLVDLAKYVHDQYQSLKESKKMCKEFPEYIAHCKEYLERILRDRELLRDEKVTRMVQKIKETLKQAEQLMKQFQLKMPFTKLLNAGKFEKQMAKLDEQIRKDLQCLYGSEASRNQQRLIRMVQAMDALQHEAYLAQRRTDKALLQQDQRIMGLEKSLMMVVMVMQQMFANGGVMARTAGIPTITKPTPLALEGLGADVTPQLHRLDSEYPRTPVAAPIISSDDCPGARTVLYPRMVYPAPSCDLPTPDDLGQGSLPPAMFYGHIPASPTTRSYTNLYPMVKPEQASHQGSFTPPPVALTSAGDSPHYGLQQQRNKFPRVTVDGSRQLQQSATIEVGDDENERQPPYGPPVTASAHETFFVAEKSESGPCDLMMQRSATQLLPCPSPILTFLSDVPDSVPRGAAAPSSPLPSSPSPSSRSFIQSCQASGRDANPSRPDQREWQTITEPILFNERDEVYRNRRLRFEGKGPCIIVQAENVLISKVDIHMAGEVCGEYGVVDIRKGGSATISEVKITSDRPWKVHNNWDYLYAGIRAGRDARAHVRLCTIQGVPAGILADGPGAIVKLTNHNVVEDCGHGVVAVNKGVVRVAHLEACEQPVCAVRNCIGRGFVVSGRGSQMTLKAPTECRGCGDGSYLSEHCGDLTVENNSCSEGGSDERQKCRGLGFHAQSYGTIHVTGHCSIMYHHVGIRVEDHARIKFDGECVMAGNETDRQTLTGAQLQFKNSFR